MSVLNGLTVVELATGLAGSVAGLLLAEAGAEVIRVERVGGDEDRERPGFAIWNRSKRSVILDLPQDAGTLHELLSRSDVLLHMVEPAGRAALQLEAPSLRIRHPHLIECHIGAFPPGHAAADLPARDTLVLAESGILAFQNGIARDSPVFPRFALGSWGAAWLAAAGVVARLLQREAGGGVGSVSTSLMQGAALPLSMHWSRATNETPELLRGYATLRAAGPLRTAIFRCSDGIWLHLMSSPDEAPLMKAALEALGPSEVGDLVRSTGGPDALLPNWGANRAIFATRPSQEWLADLWAHDVAVQPAQPLGALYFDEQAQLNGYVQEVHDPGLGRTLQPGAPISIHPPMRIRSPAPLPGADTAAQLARLRDASVPVRRREPAAETLPLRGLRVLDLGNYLAGPIAPMLMADLGAEVIKLEAASGDLMRWILPAFLSCQRGKRAIALNLKRPESRDVLERLVQWADVVHHNLRMPAARALGLDYVALRAINPSLVYCHVSSYGPDGPRRDWPGYDQMLQAASGWELESAGAGNAPMWNLAGMLDFQGGLASLLATLLGVLECRRRGTGQAVAASLLGASVLTTSETLVGPDGQLTPYERLDSQQTGLAPTHRIYRCRDGWIAVAALREHERESFYRCWPGAGHHDDAIETNIAALTVAQSLQRLQSMNVPCAPVRKIDRNGYFDDERNAASGLIARYAHPALGQLEMIGGYWTLENSALSLARRPPELGEHTREILGELGYDPEQQSRWIHEGLVRSL